MKKHFKYLFLTLFFTFLAGSVYAGPTCGPSLSPFIGRYHPDSDLLIEEGTIYGLRLGYGFSERFGIEGSLGYMPTELTDRGRRVYKNYITHLNSTGASQGELPGVQILDIENQYGHVILIKDTSQNSSSGSSSGSGSFFSDDDSAKLYNASLGVYYNFIPGSRLVPYISAGIGGEKIKYPAFIDDEQYFQTYVGGGVEYYLTERIALRADARYIWSLANDGTMNNYEYTTGVKFALDDGGCAKKPVVIDSDMDGVPDYLDKCPNTPRGVKVDQYGCPLDSDKDGVPDYLDRCPNTPIGVKVDQYGCPLDSDGDGVPDYLDRCPDTPQGVAVDQYGCPLDSDKDGVPDYLDKCPNTPIGVKVDANGCPPVVVPVAPPAVKTMELKVNFDFNRYDVKPEYLDQIKKVADFMTENPKASAVIEGHTDSVGSEQYNLKLSARRANAVAKLLTEKYGIAMERITAQSLGESKPIASNNTADGRAQNRRTYAHIEVE